MDGRVCQGLPIVLGSYRISFQAPAVFSEKVYILPAWVVIFHNANVLVKALRLLFT